MPILEFPSLLSLVPDQVKFSFIAILQSESISASLVFAMSEYTCSQCHLDDANVLSVLTYAVDHLGVEHST